MTSYTLTHLHMLLQGMLSNNAGIILEGSRLIQLQLEEEASEEVLRILQNEAKLAWNLLG